MFGTCRNTKRMMIASGSASVRIGTFPLLSLAWLTVCADFIGYNTLPILINGNDRGSLHRLISRDIEVWLGWHSMTALTNIPLPLSWIALIALVLLSNCMALLSNLLAGCYILQAVLTKTLGTCLPCRFIRALVSLTLAGFWIRHHMHLHIISLRSGLGSVSTHLALLLAQNYAFFVTHNSTFWKTIC